MKIATAKLESLSPYSQSQRLRTPRDDKEPWDHYEDRVWQERMHVNDDGFVYIPPMCFKRSLETAAKFLRMRIPGKDRSEYGKHFLAGIIVSEGLVLPVKAKDADSEWLPLSGSGKKGGMDVNKRMPLFPEWSGEVTFYVLDDTITPDVFEKHLNEAGNFIGIGRFRPEKGGFYGRYKVLGVKWTES